MNRLIAALGLALAILPGTALAQSQFPTGGGGGPNVPGSVIMCLDGSGYAVPATAAGTCLGSGGGGGTASAGLSKTLKVTPTIANSSHVAGSSVGGLQTLAVFRGTSQPTGILNNLQWIWKSGDLSAVTVYLFDTNPTATTCTDATAVAVGAADVPKLINGTPLVLSPSVVGAGAAFSAASFQSPLVMKNADGAPTVNIYGCIAINALKTPAANDGVLLVGNLQD